MLTADLVRATVRSGTVRPRYVDVASERLLGDTSRLIALFGAHVGRPVGALNEAIADHIGDSTDFMLQRGLAKLLMDAGDVEVTAERPPEEIRSVVFAEAAARWPVCPGGGPAFADRAGVMAAAAESLGISVDAVERGLFADNKDEERLVSFDPPEPEALLHRYNMALAQAVLLRARRLVVSLPGVSAKRARQLFRFIKFQRLMHRATKTRAGYEIVLDGPLSLFRQTGRYGLNLALFLPGLALAERWSLEADVVWGKERRPCRFLLDQDAGLRTHRKDTGTWTGPEEVHFQKAWKKLDTPWKLRRSARIVDLDGRGVLVPDFVVRHPDGREALVELVWFWRRASFEQRLALLAEAGPPNLIVCLARRLNADESLPDDGLPGAVYGFKGVIQPKRVLALAQQVAG